jgi:hypothetical protein
MNEVLDELIAVFGANRTAIRIGLTGRFGDMYDSQALELTKHILKDLERRKLAFVEVKRHGFIDGAKELKEGET